MDRIQLMAQFVADHCTPLAFYALQLLSLFRPSFSIFFLPFAEQGHIQSGDTHPRLPICRIFQKNQNLKSTKVSSTSAFLKFRSVSSSRRKEWRFYIFFRLF